MAEAIRPKVIRNSRMRLDGSKDENTESPAAKRPRLHGPSTRRIPRTFGSFEHNAKDRSERPRTPVSARHVLEAQRLSPIREETPEHTPDESGIKRHLPQDMPRDRNAANETFADLTDATMDWEDEETLISLLQEDISIEYSDDDALRALAEQLQHPMSAQTHALKQHFVQSLVPPVKRIKTIHDQALTKYDAKFAEGVLGFDTACQRVEDAAMREEDSLKTAYMATQAKIKALFTRLRDAHAHRDQLWNQYQAAIDQAVDSATTDLQELPAEIERTCAAMEKKGKILYKDDGGAAKAKEAILRDLMGKF